MRTKEEILQNQKHGFNSGQKESALNAMQEYADEFACSFAEWKEVEKIELSFRTARKGCIYVYKDMTYTTTELLEIFKKEQDGL